MTYLLYWGVINNRNVAKEKLALKEYNGKTVIIQREGEGSFPA